MRWLLPLLGLFSSACCVFGPYRERPPYVAQISAPEAVMLDRIAMVMESGDLLDEKSVLRRSVWIPQPNGMIIVPPEDTWGCLIPALGGTPLQGYDLVLIAPGYRHLRITHSQLIGARYSGIRMQPAPWIMLAEKPELPSELGGIEVDTEAGRYYCSGDRFSLSEDGSSIYIDSEQKILSDKAENAHCLHDDLFHEVPGSGPPVHFPKAGQLLVGERIELREGQLPKALRAAPTEN